jgi:hypothetical protein
MPGSLFYNSEKLSEDDTFMIQLHTKCYMPAFNGSLVIEYRISAAVMLLCCVLEKLPQRKMHIHVFWILGFYTVSET